ncbi:type III pantothenate kinase [Kangiella aquimarina]|uniref:Type III pantothenate kinase n=1 Tax=Kangiella aquimarina TaxID=261965 RepID=A0ABZ0X3V4_9GAMM|nr:type III pantothenate kinase [Kangiella aquimarina]WQG85277.1 type III pantothenate kinase [Kangiella aquimarina]
MILLIDVGNTRSKWALTDNAHGTSWLLSGYWDNQSFNQMQWIAQLGELKQTVEREHQDSIDTVLISCVAGEDIRHLLNNHIKEALGVSPQLPQASAEYQSQQGTKLINSYKVAEALGVDRWLAMAAATELTMPPFAVIDAGTAITLDVVGANGKHLGGHIIPGQRLMQSSLLKDTGRIAWSAQHNLDSESDNDWLATNTQQAVALGALHASVGYLESVTDKLLQHMSLNSIIMTGGDAEQLCGLLNQPIKKYVKYQKDLVLQGLFYWYLTNLPKKTADKANS